LPFFFFFSFAADLGSFDKDFFDFPLVTGASSVSTFSFLSDFFSFLSSSPLPFLSFFPLDLTDPKNPRKNYIPT